MSSDTLIPPKRQCVSATPQTLDLEPKCGICISIPYRYRAQLCPNRERTVSHSVGECDHKPLEVIYRNPLVAAPKRLQRMLLCLPKYVLGFWRMYLADTLSTAPLPITTSRDEVLTIDKEVEKIQILDSLPLRKPSLKEIHKESLRDSTIQALQKLIQSEWPETKDNLPHDVTPYFNVRGELSAQDGIVFKGDRCVVPKSLRPEDLSRIHRPHIGVEGCSRRARESVDWPGMSAVIRSCENSISQCEIRRTYDISQQKETLHPREVPDRPWSKVAVDLFELNNRHYLVTVDYYSNYWEVDRLEYSTTSKAVIYKLKQHFARHCRKTSENDPQFDSDGFRRFARDWQFDHVTSSPGHSQSTGKSHWSPSLPGPGCSKGG